MKGSRIGLHVAALLLPAAIAGVILGRDLSSDAAIIIISATVAAQIAACAAWPLLRNGLTPLPKVLLAGLLMGVLTHLLFGLFVVLAIDGGHGSMLGAIQAAGMFAFLSIFFAGLVSVPATVLVAFIVAYARNRELTHVAA